MQWLDPKNIFDAFLKRFIEASRDAFYNALYIVFDARAPIALYGSLMTQQTKKRDKLPFYLNPLPDNEKALRWFGKHLREKRGAKRASAVAKLADVPGELIQALENGEFKIGLGQLRRIIAFGYEMSFEDLLAECFEANRAIFDPRADRPYERDRHYSLVWEMNRKDKERTALLIGGDQDAFLWGIPMRRLNGQPLLTEYLELGAARKKKDGAGATPRNNHDGTEVIHVINGTVQAHVGGGTPENSASPRLEKGDSIHFRSDQPHHIENLSPISTALLLIVRFQGSLARKAR